jgi:hypothetical protein
MAMSLNIYTGHLNFGAARRFGPAYPAEFASSWTRLKSEAESHGVNAIDRLPGIATGVQTQETVLGLQCRIADLEAAGRWIDHMRGLCRMPHVVPWIEVEATRSLRNNFLRLAALETVPFEREDALRRYKAVISDIVYAHICPVGEDDQKRRKVADVIKHFEPRPVVRERQSLIGDVIQSVKGERVPPEKFEEALATFDEWLHARTIAFLNDMNSSERHDARYVPDRCEANTGEQNFARQVVDKLGPMADFLGRIRVKSGVGAQLMIMDEIAEVLEGIERAMDVASPTVVGLDQPDVDMKLVWRFVIDELSNRNEETADAIAAAVGTARAALCGLDSQEINFVSDKVRRSLTKMSDWFLGV